VNSTVVLERPKLAPYLEKMKGNIAGPLGIPASLISAEAKTDERIGLAGEGAAAFAVALVRSRQGGVSTHPRIRVCFAP